MMDSRVLPDITDISVLQQHLNIFKKEPPAAGDAIVDEGTDEEEEDEYD